MKKFYALLLFMAVSSVFAQSNESEKESLVKAERRSASKKMMELVNPNTLNYDVKHHKIELSVDPSSYEAEGNLLWLSINGKVTTEFEVLSNTNTIVFELSNAFTQPVHKLTVSNVTSLGNPIAFVHNQNNELVLTFPSPLTQGTSHSVVITYSGYPSGSGFDSFAVRLHAGVPVVSTLSEPFGARDWWPCKQDLNDKVDNGIDFYITSPTQYTAVANGLQQSKIDNGNGTSTTYFKHNYPIPAYLIAMAVTNYRIYEQQAGLGTVESPFFPITNYIFPENYTANVASVAVTPPIMNFFETKFGPYPFRDEKYGHAQFQWGGGMEHTTVSFMTAGQNGRYSRGLIAHELGHQWFGDKVTCGSWNNIWLNEGFATYLASMVIEHLDGDNAFTNDKQEMVEFITSQPGGAVYLTDDEATVVNRIFSSRLSYDKGAMVIHMLRKKLGDTIFFQALQNYLNDPELAYGFATTPDLIAHLETASGMNLTEFFNDWIYNQGYPIYDVLARNTGAGQASIQINQAQSHSSVSFFESLVPVRLSGAAGQELDVVLDNTTNGQIFNVAVPFVVTGVLFDPKSDLIAVQNNVELSTSNFDLLSSAVLYPNPTANKLTLQLPSGISIEQTTFHNALGQVTKQTTTANNWDVSQMASGIYFMTVQTNSGTTQIKFVKK